MSNNSLSYNISFSSNATALLPQINTGLEDIMQTSERVGRSIGDSFQSLLAVETIANNLNQVKQSFDEVLAPGIALNSQMTELSAITNVTGDGLKKIEKAARDSAKIFGTDATANVESYKLILSQLDPEIAKNSVAMKLMGDNVNILSKSMGGDTVAATNVLTTAMNQYGVDLKNPIAASKIMGDMMNVMAAGAQAGSAELPQIEAALEQTGMVAKTTGLSFVETNAQIQLLDKAGKKGSEGGVALRNVLTTLSEGRFASKAATEGLKQYGISTLKLADSSIPLTDRLRMLRPVMGDTALMTKVFGKENMAAGIAMIKGADTADELAKQITGTKSAVEQANIVMSSYEERSKRNKAVMEDLKISFFNITQSIAPYIQNTLGAISAIGQLATTGNSLYSIYESQLIPKTWNWIKSLFISTGATAANSGATVANTIATNSNSRSKGIGALFARIYRGELIGINTQMVIGAVISKILSSAMNGITRAFGFASISVRTFSTAIMSIPVIGWILAGVVALIAVFKYLWDHSKRFREILFGIWEAAKAVFHNIGVVIKRVWEGIVKPIIMAYWTFYKFIFTKIWDFIKMVFNAIAGVFIGLYNKAIEVFTAVKDFIIEVFMWVVQKIAVAINTVATFFSAIWEWFSSVFSGFVKFIDEWLIQPIKEAFGGVWDWIVELFEKIMEKLKGIFKPIKEFFGELFSSEGMKDVKASYKEGEKKGAASYDKDHPKEKKKEEKKKEDPNAHKKIFDVSVGGTGTVGGVAAKKVKEKESHEKGGGGGGTRSLTVGKLVETMNVHYHGTSQESKESLKQNVTEAFLTAVSDFSSVQ